MVNAYAPSETPHITVRPGVGAVGVVRQQQELEFKRLFIEKPVLICVVQGIKSVRWEGGEYLIQSGEAVAVAGGQSLDITNRLAVDSSYRALWLVPDDDLIAAYAHEKPDTPVIHKALPITQGGPALTETLERAVQAVEDTEVPHAIACHRMKELLLWIAVNGGRFGQAASLTLATKVRQLVVQDLSREWSAPLVASNFAMSEATLRRKLADEGTNLSTLLVDARMSFALQLLQSTTQPVVQIALTVGYQTPSQFAVRFRDRFGFAPTAIRRRRHALHP